MLCLSAAGLTLTCCHITEALHCKGIAFAWHPPLDHTLNIDLKWDFTFCLQHYKHMVGLHIATDKQQRMETHMQHFIKENRIKENDALLIKQVQNDSLWQQSWGSLVEKERRCLCRVSWRGWERLFMNLLTSHDLLTSAASFNFHFFVWMFCTRSNKCGGVSFRTPVIWSEFTYV